MTANKPTKPHIEAALSAADYEDAVKRLMDLGFSERIARDVAIVRWGKGTTAGVRT